jgi:hypothetical protein
MVAAHGAAPHAREGGCWVIAAAEPVSVEVDAPAPLVYQMLAAAGQGTRGPDERVEVRTREDGRMVADFWTRVPLPAGRSRMVRTREEVQFRPPDRIEYRHLDGPLRGLVESIAVAPVEGAPRRSHLRYEATFPRAGWLHLVLFRLIVRRMLRQTIAAHFEDLRARAEARARRSRVFAEVTSSDAPR